MVMKKNKHSHIFRILASTWYRNIDSCDIAKGQLAKKALISRGGLWRDRDVVRDEEGRGETIER